MTVFVPAGHLAWVAWIAIRTRSAHRLAMFALASILSMTIALTLYAPALPDMLHLRASLHALDSDQPTMLGAEGWHALLQLGGSWTWWAAVPGLILTMAGFASVVMTSRGDRGSDGEPAATTFTPRDVMALMWLGLPLLGVAVWASGSWCYARFALFAMPAVVVSIALAVDRLWRIRPWIGWLSMAMLALTSCLDLALLPPKQPLADAADLVRAQSLAGELVLVIGLGHPVMDVYSDEMQLSYTLPHGADLAQHLQGASGSTRPRWIIIYYPESVAKDALDMLRLHGYAPFARFDGWVDWRNGDVIVYREELSDGVTG
jgi:hypothetical protein